MLEKHWLLMIKIDFQFSESLAAATPALFDPWAYYTFRQQRAGLLHLSAARELILNL